MTKEKVLLEIANILDGYDTSQFSYTKTMDNVAMFDERKNLTAQRDLPSGRMTISIDIHEK